MASYSSGLSAAGYILYLEVTEVSINVNANTSTVNWSLYITKGSGSGKWSNYVTYWSTNIGGYGYSGSRSSYDFRGLSAGQAIVWASGSTVIPHKADGSITIGVSGSFSESVAQLGSGTASGSLALTTIPRATTAVLTPNPIEVDQEGIIYLPRASPSFTHKVEYIFGSATGVIANPVDEETTWTPDISLLNQIPNSTAGPGLIRVTTYSGATVIGTRDTPITILAPASVVPDFTTITHAEATPGLDANIGAYVQGLTTLNLAITGAAGVYGSTIVSGKIEVPGQLIAALSGTTPTPLALAGTYNIIGTVTDSRNRSRSKTVAITVLPYAPPSLTAISVERALSSGTPDDEGTYLRININALVQSLLVGGVEKNELVYRIFTRDHNSLTPYLLKKTVSTGAVVFNSHDVVGTYGIEDSWDVRIEVSDDFITSALLITIPTAAIFMHWDGKLGIGLGKYREEGALDALGTLYHKDGEEVASLVDVDEVSDDLALVEDRMLHGFLPAGSVMFTSSGTFNKADYPGLRAIRVRVVGGGGSGGGAWTSAAAPNVSFGYGGGGGGYAESFITDIAALPASVAVTVGAGGVGTVGTAAGTSGGASSFGSLVAATGGVFGWSKPNSVFGGYFASPLGGNGTAGDIRISGTPGGAGQVAGQGLASSGMGGSTPLGAGAQAVGASTSPLSYGGISAVPLGFGGGGGGALSSSNGGANVGGAGAPGIVIVERFV